jgi:hypothetical protein
LIDIDFTFTTKRYVLEHLYDHIFAARQEDREKDREISQLIKRFYFITPEHLDIPYLREYEGIFTGPHKVYNLNDSNQIYGEEQNNRYCKLILRVPCVARCAA